MWPAIVIIPVWSVHGAGRGEHVRSHGLMVGAVPLRATTGESLTDAMLVDLMVPPSPARPPHPPSSPFVFPDGFDSSGLGPWPLSSSPLVGMLPSGRGMSALAAPLVPWWGCGSGCHPDIRVWRVRCRLRLGLLFRCRGASPGWAAASSQGVESSWPSWVTCRQPCVWHHSRLEWRSSCLGVA